MDSKFLASFRALLWLALLFGRGLGAFPRASTVMRFAIQGYIAELPVKTPVLQSKDRRRHPPISPGSDDGLDPMRTWRFEKAKLRVTAEGS